MDKSKELTGRDPFVDKTKVTITRGDPRSTSPALDGIVKEHPGYTFQSKIFDVGSKFGINGGRVSKVTVKKDGKEVFRYDRIWIVKPKNKEQKAVLKQIMKAFPSPTMELKQKFQRMKDKIREEIGWPIYDRIFLGKGQKRGAKLNKGERVITPENPMSFFSERSGGASGSPSKDSEKSKKLESIIKVMST